MKEITFDAIRAANEEITPTTIERKDKKTGKTTKKDYAEVNQRIKAFRMVCPDGFISTEMLMDDDGICEIKARVGYYRDNGTMHILGTGHAREEKSASYINQTSYIENCETSAVGRALGMAGFGIDTAVASAEEIQNANTQQTGEAPASDPMKRVIIDKCIAHGIDLDKWLKQGGVNNIDELTAAQGVQMIETLRRLYGDEQEAVNEKG